MTSDEQIIIFELMRENGFQPIDAEPSALGFQRIENNESIQVFLTKEFPFYVETKYANVEPTADLVARQTQMMKSFERTKEFAAMGVTLTIDGLRKEIESKLNN